MDEIRLGGNGTEVSIEEAKKWKNTLDAANIAMLNAGGFIGRLGALSLIFAVGEPQVKIHPSKVTSALMALAVFQGRVDVNEKGVDKSENLINFRSRT